MCSVSLVLSQLESGSGPASDSLLLGMCLQSGDGGSANGVGVDHGRGFEGVMWPSLGNDLLSDHNNSLSM